MSPVSITSWVLSLLHHMAPMLAIFVHGKFKFFFSRMTYRPIYKSLPRPTGDSMFSGLPISAPRMEFDTPDQDIHDRNAYRREDEQTLRALEGLPETDRTEPPALRNEGDPEATDDEDVEVAHATLISFDVEATEAVENSQGTWSAELRSANEPKAADGVKYRVTGMTMLPPIMATEGLREVFAGILVMPVEALMVRVIGSAYRNSSGSGMEDMFAVNSVIRGWGNLFSVLSIQVAVTGVIWAGFTVGVQMWANRRRAMLAGKTAAEGDT